ncbi:MAG: glycine betaine ABC transporter substrate-binding protein, partial [Pseudomonadota bacterium]|nr:glycine betaine ABC transporter substrate-binding protein [Pseudomonadota bacterium]
MSRYRISAIGHGVGGVVLALLLLLVPAPANADPARCSQPQPIRLAQLTWESGRFYTALARVILEKGYGCTTVEMPGAAAALETALAAGDIHVIAEQWVGRSPIMDKAVAAGHVVVKGDLLHGGAQQGWYVPDYLVHGDAARGIPPLAPGLKTPQDLKHHAHLFADPETPGKGRFHNCPSGWTCETFNTHLLAMQGLEDHFSNFHPGTGAALDAAISAAWQRGEPIVFYYWQPTALMAQYKWVRLQFPPFDATCWQQLLEPDGQPQCATGFAVSRLGMALSAAFQAHYPAEAAALARIQLTPQQLDAQLLAMAGNAISDDAAVHAFLREYPESWRGWMDAAAADRIANQLDSAPATAAGFFLPLSIAQPLNRSLATVVAEYGGVFHAISRFTLRVFLQPIESLLLGLPPWLLIALTALLAWHATRRWPAALLCAAGFYLIGAFGLWQALMQTLALVVVATTLTVLVGVPIGIAAAYQPRLDKLLKPLLDV